MKKEYRRSKDLPVFSIELAELEVLANQIKELFTDGSNFSLSISLRHRSEKLEFDDIAELKSSALPRKSYSEFSIHASDHKLHRRIHLMTSDIGYSTSVSATANNDAWCAGAIEVVHTFFSNRKRWYSSLIVFPASLIIWILATVFPTLLRHFLSPEKWNGFPAIASLLTSLAIILFFLFRKSIVPAAEIRISKEENFLKKYAVEITIFGTLLSLLLNAIQVFRSNH